MSQEQKDWYHIHFVDRFGAGRIVSGETRQVALAAHRRYMGDDKSTISQSYYAPVNEVYTDHNR